MNVSIDGAIAEAAKALSDGGVDQPQMEASLLLSHLLGCDRAFLIAHGNETLSSAQDEAFGSLVERRAVGEPLQYITGHQGFFKLDFEVTPDVLIPRPETELIVEATLEFFAKQDALYFADIGTGSGCIAISLLHELPNARAIAVDISAAALEVARRNAERHRVSDRLQFIESDGFAAIDENVPSDLIVSNPPYVPEKEMKGLPREVRREPARALAGGTDGFAVIRRLLQDAPLHLHPDGRFIFEIGFGQSEMVKGLIDADVWELIEIRKDLQGIPRAVVLRRN